MKKRNGFMIRAWCAVLATMAILVLRGAAFAEKTNEEDRYARVESADGVRLSDTKTELYPADILKLDADWEEIFRHSVIEAEIWLPLGLDNVRNVILTDGWRIAYAAWEKTGEHTYRTTFATDALKDFYRTQYLYLIMICGDYGAQ